MSRKLDKGYKKVKKNKRKSHNERRYVSKLIMPFGRKISFSERILKFIIYIALRIILPRRKWKYPKKNIEIIDRTYTRIMSADFIYIPSSIAFYLIMAFMPVFTIIAYMSLIPGIGNLLSADDNPLIDVLNKAIPGIADILKEIIENARGSNGILNSITANVGTLAILFTSLWIASGGFSKLVYTQSYLYKFKYVGGYWMNRFRGIFIVVGLALILGITLVTNIYFTKFLDNVISDKHALRITKLVYLYAGMLVLLGVLFAGLFKLTPRYKIKLRHVMPGVAVTTFPTAIFLGLFGFITSVWSYSSYGTIGTLMYIGMSSLFISYFTFLGLVCNVSYFNTFVNKPLTKKLTFSRK